LKLTLKNLFRAFFFTFKQGKGNPPVITCRQTFVVKLEKRLISFQGFPVFPKFTERVSLSIPRKKVLRLKLESFLKICEGAGIFFKLIIYLSKPAKNSATFSS